MLYAWAGLALADYDAASPQGVDLSGTWRLNPALSDDAEAMLAEQLEEEREREMQWRRREERVRPAGGPDELDARASRSGAQRPWQRRRIENFRQMLGITNTLTIRQQGANMEIVSAVESRRFEAGTHSQVSMPQGDLADSEVGWDGDWFVIDRRARGGPRVLERFRLLVQSDQLEYRMKVRGETELSGMDIRRIFDRAADGAVLHNPAMGPVR